MSTLITRPRAGGATRKPRRSASEEKSSADQNRRPLQLAARLRLGLRTTADVSRKLLGSATDVSRKPLALAIRLGVVGWSLIPWAIVVISVVRRVDGTVGVTWGVSVARSVGVTWGVSVARSVGVARRVGITRRISVTRTIPVAISPCRNSSTNNRTCGEAYTCATPTGTAPSASPAASPSPLHRLHGTSGGIPPRWRRCYRRRERRICQPRQTGDKEEDSSKQFLRGLHDELRWATSPTVELGRRSVTGEDTDEWSNNRSK
jgi:hypothetical protein